MTDFLQIIDHLTSEEKLVQKTAQQFTEKEILPNIRKQFRDGIFPKEIMQKFGKLGFLGVTIPEKYGGAEMSNIAYGLICQELEAGDSAMRSAVSVQGSLVMFPIFSFGSEEQKQKWLPKLATGETIGCYGLTEPDYGSDPANLITRAKKTDNGYILNGAKMWITNAPICDVAVVWAKTDDGVIRGFLVEKGFSGFSAPEMTGKLSLRASITGELVFDDVFVPEENLLPNVEGLKGPLSCLTQARYGIAWGVIGAARAVYESSVRYSKERIQFGKPIASKQIVQEKLVWMLSEITKAQLLALQIGQMKDAGKSNFAHISMGKRNNVWMARECCKLAREIHGANGILDEYPVMRHLMNLESVFTYEGTHDMHTLILGEQITGISAFR